MKIRDLTVPELNHYRQFCNFTPTEAQFFELRAGDATLEDCCEIMCCSKSFADDLSRRVKSKMNRV